MMKRMAVRPVKRLFSPFFIISLLILTVLLLAVISMGVGAVFISPNDVIAAFMGSGTKSQLFILENYRLPRVLLACLAGAGLAVSGAILQGIIRNPLASPDVIGITKGAGLAATVVLILFPKSPVYFLPISAFMGSGLVAVLLFLFAYRQGAKPSTLALVGIALGAICQAGIQYLMIKFPVDINAALIWLTGSLWGRGWEQVIGLLPWFIVLFPLVFILASKLDVLNLGDEVAEGLGENVKHLRYWLLAISVALAGVCVAVVGSIGFVGLVAPHMARRVIGARHRLMLPVSASFGAIILLISDGLGRGLVPPIEIPAGIITAVIGAPYFLYLLRRERKQP